MLINWSMGETCQLFEGECTDSSLFIILFSRQPMYDPGQLFEKSRCSGALRVVQEGTLPQFSKCFPIQIL